LKGYIQAIVAGLCLTMSAVTVVWAIELYDIYSKPIYKIRTDDGIYYSNAYKHSFEWGVEFVDINTREKMKKSQKKVHGTIIERIY